MEYTFLADFSDCESDLSELVHRRCSKRQQGEDLEVIQAVNTHSRKEVEYHIYGSENKSTTYDHTVIQNVSKSLKHMNV